MAPAGLGRLHSTADSPPFYGAAAASSSVHRAGSDAHISPRAGAYLSLRTIGTKCDCHKIRLLSQRLFSCLNMLAVVKSFIAHNTELV